MKKSILVFAALVLIVLVSCTKQASKELAPVKMNYEELSKELGSSLAFTLFDNAGKTEADPASRTNARKVKANATLSVLADLSLTESGGVLTTTISPNAQWAGVQKFFTIDSTNNGVSVCNWFYWSAPGAGVTKTCQSNGAGSYRSWTSDFDYTVHLSDFLPL